MNNSPTPSAEEIRKNIIDDFVIYLGEFGSSYSKGMMAPKSSAIVMFNILKPHLDQYAEVVAREAGREFLEDHARSLLLGIRPFILEVEGINKWEKLMNDFDQRVEEELG